MSNHYGVSLLNSAPSMTGSTSIIFIFPPSPPQKDGNVSFIQWWFYPHLLLLLLSIGFKRSAVLFFAHRHAHGRTIFNIFSWKSWMMMKKILGIISRRGRVADVRILARRTFRQIWEESSTSNVEFFERTHTHGVIFLKQQHLVLDKIRLRICCAVKMLMKLKLKQEQMKG